MERNLRWTNRALGRLDAIADTITFVNELRKNVNILKTHLPGKAGRVFGTKELVLHKNYVAVYRVKDNEVQVLTILHATQNK